MVASVSISGEGGKRRRGAWPAIAVSLAVHAAFFLAVGLIVPKPRLPPTEQLPPVKLILIPAPERLQHEHVQARSANQAPLTAPAPAATPTLHVHMPKAVTPAAPPSPIAGAEPGPASPARPGTSIAPGPLPYDDGEHGVRAFLRGTVGCESPDAVHLTAEERARCAEHFATTARSAQPFSAIDPAKRGAYSLQAEADERKRAAREGMGPSPIVSCTGVGSNMGVGCLPDSAMGHVRIP